MSPSQADVVVVLAVEVHPELLDIPGGAILHLGKAGLHLKLLGVVEPTPLADEADVNLRLLLVGREVLVAIPQVLGADLKLGGMVNAQIISNGVTIRNDTRVTSQPS